MSEPQVDGPTNGSPRPPLAFDRVAETYDQTRGGEERGEHYADALGPLLDPGSLTLEIGVGTGIVAMALARRGFRVAGLDVSLPMIRRARDRIGDRVVVGDARRMPFADASVPQAVSVWVLHVVGDVPQMLAEVARVLRPGGRYVVVPGQMQARHDEIGERVRALEQALDPERRRNDSPERIAGLAPAAGLRVVGIPEHTWEFHLAPEAVAQMIEARSQSYLWDVDDERWRTLVVPVIEWLRSLPDPERPIVRRSDERLAVLERT
ncbi:MAG TPA: class I SAM-dependent methyltransferase [Actinomycetota bacterium]